ncbi:hypothetical protein FRC07_012787 [Ceratobasidium sp. 392]|nr:hypothetical protein FRC07_012787 [Ceratobasidium sp. 392]
MSTQGAKILLLTAVAGAGKTTIAHTIAQRCAEKDQLVSSFFFDRETEGRNNASALFSSIAADISQLDNYLAERITAAIEADRALPTAPLSRQFEELVLKPCQGYNASKPVVFVIDGLDEAWNDHLLNILRDHSFHLPSAFRIFLTSRMRPELDSLCRQPHVRRVNFDIGTQTNMDDIALFIPHKLQQLARDRDLGENWPTNQVLSSFISKADGLFLWVVTVCEYLRGRDDPTEELNELLTTDDLQATSAEEQMDRLYATILESFDWTDARFVAGYHRVMGMAIATHTPLTISAMKALYREEPLASDYALQRMSPLLTGMNREDHGSEAVRVLHQSLRDFLVARASHSPHYTNFQIAEKKQSQQLALLCLKIMNRELSENIVGTGFLSINEYETRGVPSMSDGHISEALWYACQFWLDHILDVESPLLIEEALQVFMAWKAVLWMEVLAARGRCRRLTEVQTWMQGQKSDEEYADTCMSLSARLIYDDRQEEALDITEEAVGLYRKFSDNNNTRYSPVLASSLKELSDRLSELGRYHEALLVMQESVELHQKLVITNGLDEFMPELAAALSGLSVRLASLGRHSEALTEIEKAVELARQLAVDGSNEGISQLAKYLNNLSVYLSALGRYEEALLQTEQVVEIRRRLAADDPNSFAYSLAKSLNSLSIRLSDLNRHNEALPVIQEAVRLYRKLAIMRPAAMTLDLAISLNNLSRRLTNLGRHEEALPVMQEAVELHRRLATNRPAACIPNLAMSLNNLALCILALERPEEALPVMQEAAELHQQLATTSPSAYTADLKRSLNGLADIFTRLSRDVEANDAREKASKLC